MTLTGVPLDPGGPCGPLGPGSPYAYYTFVCDHSYTSLNKIYMHNKYKSGIYIKKEKQHSLPSHHWVQQILGGQQDQEIPVYTK